MKRILIVLCLAACTQGRAQETFLLKKTILQETKQRLARKDAPTQQALAELAKECDTLLTRGPYSVTYKTKTPPSGNKHDYMSVGPYWWPDPSKPDGLPYIRKDGQVNPERNHVRDADYQNTLNHDVYTLAIGWYFTGNDAYARHAAKLLRTWYIDTATRMNPHLNYGQAIPGITEGRGIGLIDTRNVDKLIDGVQLLKGSKALPEKDYKALQAWCREFLTWMRTSPVGLDEADEHNNHGTWYDVQAVSLALFTGQRDSARVWLEQGTKARIESQLAADGSQPHELARTLSWNYSQMNLKAFFELALLAENVNVDLWHYQTKSGKTIEKAFTWLLPFAEGKQEWKHQQIKHMDTNGYLELAVMAGRKYPQLDLKALWQKYPDFHEPVLQLVAWKY
jgi:hypothetical protein